MSIFSIIGKYKSPFIISGLLLFFSFARAQGGGALPVPYGFSFEESEAAELSQWVFNPGANTSTLSDQWVVGEATHSDGHRSAYISCNKGVDANFAATTNIQYLYRDFTLPAGQYDCTFDFRCMGAPDAFISAGVGPASMVNIEGGPNTLMPENILTYIPKEMLRVRSVSKWKNTSFQFSSNGTRVLRLFFVWQNSNRDTTITAVGACIDNIQITSRACAKPRSITAESRNDSIIIDWEGSSEEYILEYRKYGRSKWMVQTGIINKHYVIEGMEEGAYDIRIRGVCNGDEYSAYTYLNAFAVYYPDHHCIDYVHLEDNPNVVATYGTYTNPYENIGVVDYGPEDKLSRHVVNWEQEVTDPRTKGKLRVVPEGALASVRLGNWSVNSQAESLSYTYVVDAQTAAILLVRYAIVMEDPQHNVKIQPRFTLEIMDQYGELISPDCGYADFYADATREGWHTEGSGYNMVTWKDWTTIGLNLEDRDGDTLTVRLTTYDCNAGGHYGYAYFTLDCAAARIIGTSCGDDAQMSISAPLGFDYEWFNKDNDPVPASQLADKGMTLLVDATDTTTYRCHLTYLEEQSCGFDLYSSARPRFPISSFEWEYAPAECSNRVKFINKSHIMTKYNNNIEFHYDQPCDEYEWDFGNGQVGAERNPVVIFPAEGGTFQVTLLASIAEGRCVDDTVITVTIPAIGDKEVHVDTAICDGSYIVFGPQYIAISGEYENTWVTPVGCDSTVKLTVTVNPVSNEFMGDTTVCAENPLIINDQLYKPQSDGIFYVFYKNRFGCDSTIWMNVTILDSIIPEVRVREVSESPNSGAIYISGTGYDYYTVNGGEPQHADSLTGLNGGMFVLEFYNDFGCSVSDTAIVSVCMPGWVYQRWGDVLSLKNASTLELDSAEHVFTDYQWFKDGEPIEGANMSYLYVPEGLDTASIYYLEMVRVSDSTKVTTCPFKPVVTKETPEVYVYPSPIRSGGTLTIKVTEAATATIVDMFGNIVLTQNLIEGANSVVVNAPAGVYVVRIEVGDKSHVCRISVTE